MIDCLRTHISDHYRTVFHKITTLIYINNYLMKSTCVRTSSSVLFKIYSKNLQLIIYVKYVPFMQAMTNTKTYSVMRYYSVTASFHLSLYKIN